MATININGSNFEYIEKGSGTPVIFVHGSLNDYRIWKDQMDPFSQNYRAIAYSRRYHYPNKWNGDGLDYSLDLHVQDLVSLIKALNLDSVHLIGSSYGAYTSLITAIKNPGLIKTVVLGEPPVLPLLVTNPDNPLQLFSLFFKNFSAAKTFMRFGLRYMKPAQNALKNNQLEQGARIFANGALGEGGYEKLAPEMQSSFMDNAPSLKAELLGSNFPPFPENEAKHLKIPALFVYGENSPELFHIISDLLMKLMPGSEKVVIPNASHLIQCQNPTAYNNKVLGFLSRY